LSGASSHTKLDSTVHNRMTTRSRLATHPHPSQPHPNPTPTQTQPRPKQPSKQHFYQPLWTLVGGGFKNVEESVRPMGDVLPPGVDWLPTAVAAFDPSNDRLSTTDGKKVSYDYLVVATGIQAKWGKVKGLTEALGDGRVVSNMSFKTAPMTHKAVQALQSGHALFTMPKGVVKCPGAGHKVCYIAEEQFRRAGKRPAVGVTLALAGDKIFGIPRYAATIQELVKERDIAVKLNTNLIEVRGRRQEAVFEILGLMGQVIGEEVTRYDMLHVTPPQGPLDVVAQSQLANEEGWVAINQEVRRSGFGSGVGRFWGRTFGDVVGFRASVLLPAVCGIRCRALQHGPPHPTPSRTTTLLLRLAPPSKHPPRADPAAPPLPERVWHRRLRRRPHQQDRCSRRRPVPRPARQPRRSAGRPQRPAAGQVRRLLVLPAGDQGGRLHDDGVWVRRQDNGDVHAAGAGGPEQGGLWDVAGGLGGAAVGLG